MHPRHLEALLRQLVVLGTLAVLLIPAARGSVLWIGWLPLWLVGMPLAAWWSLRRFPLPKVTLALPTRRRAQAQRRRLRRAPARHTPAKPAAIRRA